jgi:flavin-dependent dehydrogenase
VKSDVTIIGGGPAGSTAAILLARAGWDVILVEQSRFPRSKVCGECLSALGFDVLTRLGLHEPFTALGAVQLNEAALHSASGGCKTVTLPAPMWGLSRNALDTFLLDRAREAGAVILQPVRCEHLNGRTLQFRDLVTNQIVVSSPSHILLADGKAAFASDPPASTDDFGIKTHFANVDGPRDTIELFGVAGSYGGLAAVEGNRWNAAFSVPAARVKACRGNIDSLFDDLVAENRTLARRLERATRCAEWLASSLPRFSVRTNWPADVIPIGNAAAALEPIGGEGMGLAMRSAELAVESMLCESATSSGVLAGRYQHLWRSRRLGCRAAALAVSRPMIGNALLRSRMPRALTQFALKVIGK